MRKLACVLLAFGIVFSTCLPAFADTVQGEDALIQQELEISEEEMAREMLAQMPFDEECLLSAKLISEDSLGKTLVTAAGARSTNVTVYYYETLNMPSASFYIVATGWEEETYQTTTYNGYNCLCFTNESFPDMIVYVKATAFYPAESSYNKMGRCPSDEDLSALVTSYLNNESSSAAYSGYWNVYNTTGVPMVTLAMFSTNSFRYETDEIVLTSKVLLDDGALSNPSAPCYPEIKLEITNTGAGQRYLGGYYIKARGASDGIDDILDLVMLGFTVVPIAKEAVVTGLSLESASALLTAVIPEISGAFERESLLSRTRISDTFPLSSPGDNIYTYSCSLKCPLALKQVDDMFQIHAGLLGSDGEALSYKVTITFSNTAP